MRGRKSNGLERGPALSRLQTVGGPANRSPTLEGVDHLAQLLALVVATLICLWAVAVLLFRPVRFAVLAPQAAVAVEAAGAMARLFAALVLSLFSAHRIGQRLSWVAAGFAILGAGGLAFGFLQPLLFSSLDFNTSIYAAHGVRILAGTLFVIGLVPARPPAFTRRSLLTSLLLFGIFCVAIVRIAAYLPPLIQAKDFRQIIAADEALLSGLTPWHWALSLIPFGLSTAAAWGAARHGLYGTLGRWLLVAMVLLAGSQLHSMFWPSAYSPVLTTADMLRLLFAAVVTIGGALELRRVAGEYARLLDDAREHSQRLAELSRLKADFTAMVAHELSSPIAAIRGFTDMLATGSLDRQAQMQALDAIRAETDMLHALVADVHASAQVEREDFTLQRRPVPLDDLLDDAAVFARTLPGNHQIKLSAPSGPIVLADPDRINQVLRNLLSNAAKYSAPGTPIEIRAVIQQNVARVEVTDRGRGIDPADLKRIFEKFGRGRDETGRAVPGIGLGLYLSQRIIRAHGSELTVRTAVGEGSTFAFELEVIS